MAEGPIECSKSAIFDRLHGGKSNRSRLAIFKKDPWAENFQKIQKIRRKEKREENQILNLAKAGRVLRERGHNNLNIFPIQDVIFNVVTHMCMGNFKKCVTHGMEREMLRLNKSHTASKTESRLAETLTRGAQHFGTP